MADFVAVIRRTVDGLSDNVPEMRAKVYEKARGAVRRQLESMKPRPSDEMIERQMVKLEAAINEVESDHAEALPALDDGPVDSVAAGAAAELADAAAETAAVDEAQPVAEPVAEERHVDAAEERYYEPVEPVEAYDTEAVPAVEETAEPPAYEETVAHETVSEPVAEVEETVSEQTESEPATETAPQQPEIVETRETVEASVQDEPSHSIASEQPEALSVETSSPDDGHAADDLEEELVAQSSRPEDKPMPAASSEWELPEWSDPVPAVAHSEPVWTEAAGEVAITEEIPDLSDYESVETVVQPRAESDGKGQEAAEPSHSWAWDDSDPFTQSPAPVAAESTEPAISDWSWPVEKPAAVEPEGHVSSGSAWNDVDELLEHGSVATATGAAAAFQQSREAAGAGPEDMAAPSRPVSYRAEPKRSPVNLKVIAIVAAVLIVVGGGAYAYWRNQDVVNSWVAAAIESLTAQVPGQKTPDATTPEEGAKDVATPQTSTQTETPPGTDVASLDSNNPKFTQRLQADGSEVDQGPAPVPGGEAATEEGKSVAAQTEAGTPQNAAQAAPAGQAADAQPAQPVPEQQTAANPTTQQIPAGAQKMFLYEERLGQSAPTAIEGNVAWSVKEESPGGDAKPEPVVQAQINVPERGLTALMTIKRNADSSLPASHVIEFVFSLPENFEGGSIESVQRVAMKRNEQDRGDPLIAVPAKITEDFHMIALNDFPEAVATNIELLRSRTWIDIPLTYRNGRRALLTLEKGPAGTEAFTKAMQAWSLVTKPNPAGQ
ncbi:hypothetical protein [Pararhizobium sp. A13]|uniref:hypothetical protein n=1 Tax=Pararhizobium sp. A13 TaxID=3133975 RepID=UPI0032444A19